MEARDKFLADLTTLSRTLVTQAEIVVVPPIRVRLGKRSDERLMDELLWAVKKAQVELVTVVEREFGVTPGFDFRLDGTFRNHKQEPLKKGTAEHFFHYLKRNSRNISDMARPRKPFDVGQDYSLRRRYGVDDRRRHFFAGDARCEADEPSCSKQMRRD